MYDKLRYLTRYMGCVAKYSYKFEVRKMNIECEIPDKTIYMTRPKIEF